MGGTKLFWRLYGSKSDLAGLGGEELTENGDSGKGRGVSRSLDE